MINEKELERKFNGFIRDLVVTVYRRGANGKMLYSDQPDDDYTKYYVEVNKDGVTATHAFLPHPSIDDEIGHIARRLVLKWAEARHMQRE